MRALANNAGLRRQLGFAALFAALIALLALAPDVLAQSEHGASSSESSGSSEESGSGSFLVSPELGLMLWTLLLFGATMFILSRYAFPKIGEALEKRANAIRENIEASEKQREEADTLLEEYRQRLTEAREQADDIAARARKAAEAAVAEATSEGKSKREELVAAARKDIETETRRSLEQIRKEVADLTVLATEKVTRKSLDDDDHKRLIEDALSEVDFTALSGAESNGEGEGS
ncbi:MAG: F0F1 ATP synthase subunit B [Solirubrobacterales bacterium]